ncbi:hypothetical protein GLYMA_06G238951v4 [Glycine max]|nr:hypothetical protein GLYMA_06G238951v4 [Glycine max]KAH1127363.1 hypothetical protein GYH30_016088 [Glycine max]
MFCFVIDIFLDLYMLVQNADLYNITVMHDNMKITLFFSFHIIESDNREVSKTSEKDF